MSLTNGRVSELAFMVYLSNQHYTNITDIPQVVNIVFFGTAIFAAAVRITVRLWLHHGLRLDDCLLLFSCASLTAATAVLYYGTPSIVLAAELTFDPAAVLENGIDETDILHRVELIPKINWTYLALSWTTIFFSNIS